MADSKTMTSAVLVPCAQTDWQTEGRYATRTPISINEQGRQAVQDWATHLTGEPPAAVYSSGRDPAAQTARLLAEAFNLKPRKIERLEEIDLGLWEGLTPEDLSKRFAKTFRQWKEDPSNVCPPDGEAVPKATERLIKELNRVGRKYAGQCFAVVLAPLAFAALRCHLEGRDYTAMWELMDDQPVRYMFHPEAGRPILST